MGQVYLPNQHYWFLKSNGTRQFQERFVGKVTQVMLGKVTWSWLFDPDQLDTRLFPLLQKQRTQHVTDEEIALVNHDPAYSLRNVKELLRMSASCSPQLFSPLQNDLTGFLMKDPHKWSYLLQNWLPNFNPLGFLTRRINSEAPTGDAKAQWVKCVKALTNLIGQYESRCDDGFLVSNPTYDQLTLLARCLPILLLRVPKKATMKTKQQLMRQHCNLFLRGSWQSLALKAGRELRELNERAQQHAQTSQKRQAPNQAFKAHIALERTKALQTAEP